MVVAKLSLSLSPMYVDMNRNSDPTGNPTSVSHQSSWPVISHICSNSSLVEHTSFLIVKVKQIEPVRLLLLSWLVINQIIQ